MQNAFFFVKSKRIDELCKMQTMENNDEFDSRPDEAKRLTEARKARGFKTVKDAVDYFGWVYESYVQHENGLRGIKKQAHKYAKAYRVSPGWLLTGEGTGPDGESKSIDAKMRLLPPDEFEDLYEDINAMIERRLERLHKN